ncbi:MAG: hypothetical protein H6584_06090 [Flavobacteriales bacterium]|nr:hypothetical protein [Flavobacteriales bacterium]
MEKVYHLSTCSTNKRILKSLSKIHGFEFQDIKKEPITEEQLDQMAKLSGSYESLFSKKAQLYKSRGLKDKNLQESDFKSLLLEHYTFLARPVIISGNAIFIGNSPKNIEALIQKLG